MIPFAVQRRLLYAYNKIMTKWDGCIFCQIIADEMPARVIHADDHCIAIEDVHPKAPVHALVLPRKHIATLADGSEEDGQLLGHLLLVAARVAKDKGLHSFRTVINTNAEAGQTVFHLHLHVMGGRTMRWPPG
jgi:histidine triad (HIT) family protein